MLVFVVYPSLIENCGVDCGMVDDCMFLCVWHVCSVCDDSCDCGEIEEEAMQMNWNSIV